MLRKQFLPLQSLLLLCRLLCGGQAVHQAQLMCSVQGEFLLYCMAVQGTPLLNQATRLCGSRALLFLLDQPCTLCGAISEGTPSPSYSLSFTSKSSTGRRVFPKFPNSHAWWSLLNAGSLRHLQIHFQCTSSA